MQLKADELACNRGGREVFRSLNFALSAGEAMVVTGRNGAGKSSLMRTIATLQQPDGGSIMLGEIDVLRQPDAVRRLLGYLPQEFGLYPNLSAEMVLDHFATLKGLTESKARKRVVDALLDQVNLADARKKTVGGFSGGMKQRLGIAIALAGDPRLIIVDEPTAGLDPSERYRFLNLLAEIGQDRHVRCGTGLAGLRPQDRRLPHRRRRALIDVAHRCLSFRLHRTGARRGWVVPDALSL